MVVTQQSSNSSEDGKKTLDYRSILKVKTTEFPNVLNMGYERKRMAPRFLA